MSLYCEVTLAIWTFCDRSNCKLSTFANMNEYKNFGYLIHLSIDTYWHWKSVLKIHYIEMNIILGVLTMVLIHNLTV